MFKLYPDQRECLVAVSNAYKAGARRVLLTAPTGSGKTVIFSYAAVMHASRGGRVTILVHREELIDQVHAALREWGVNSGVISPNWRPIRSKPIQIASVFSLIRRIDRLPVPTFVIVDEAHHAVASTTWGKILAAYSGGRVLGVTATPIRAGGAGLADCFDRLVIGPSVAALQAAGRLAPLTTYAPSEISVDGLKRARGDYVKGELAARADTQTITGDAVQHYKRLAYGKQFVAFCVSVEHAQHVAQQFTMAGIQAEAIDGKLPHDDRKRRVDAFRRRAITGLVSCDLISEGFDIPFVEVGISLRPTASLGLFIQQVGRIMRAAPGKTALLLDHAGNTLRHGLITDDREWSLDGAPPGREKERSIGVKICPSCFAANRSTATVCAQPKCRMPFPIKPREVKEREGELQEVDADELRRARLREQSGARDLESLTALGRLRGYRKPEQWARFLIDARRRKGRA